MNTIEKLVEALKDALSGWKYIREVHGDLYGVGWERVEKRLANAIALGEAELRREPDATVCRDFSRITPQTHSFQIDKFLPVGATLYTRGEIK